MEKGLLVEVLRGARGCDCTNGGVSAQRAEFVLVQNGDEIGPFEPSDKYPALYLARWYGRVIACPANLEVLCAKKRSQRPDSSIDYLGNWMFGGNYVESCDSRLREINEYPIPVYDRREA